MAGDAEVPEAAGVATEAGEVPVDVVDVTAAAPAKKKKRSKAKKGGSGSSSGGWRIEERPGKGRCFIATRAFRVGEPIVDEHPYAWVVLQRYLSQVCHTCSKLVNVASRVICGDCVQAFYCSRECQDANKPVHSRECQAFAQLESIARVYSVDVTLLRLTVAAVCRHAVIGKDDPGYARVQQLVTNESEFSKDWVSSVTEGCAAVAPLLPDDVDRDAHNMFLICCRINSNAHGLCVDARNNSMALGLLPTCSMINHSCAPNSSFSSDYTAAGPRVTVRAVKDIKAGDEVTYAYVDLYASRAARQHELRTSKFFTCACERCQTGEDDRLLGGFVCPRKGCTGAVHEGPLPTVAATASAAEPSSSEPPAAVHQGESKNKRKKAKGKPKPKPAAAEASTSAAGSDANAASTSAPPSSSNGAAASEVPIGYCNECRHAVELTANYAALAQAENAFQRLSGPPDKKTLLDLLAQLSPILHPRHTLILQIHSQLLNVSDSLQEYSASAEYCKHIIQSLEAICGYYDVEVSNFYFHLGTTYKDLAKALGTSHHQKVLAKRYLAQAAEAFTHCRDIRAVCCGPEHSLTLEAAQNLK